MKTLLILQYLLILIISSISFIREGVSESRDDLGETDHVLEWKNQNEGLRNESNSDKNNEDESSRDKDTGNTKKSDNVVVVEKIIRPDGRKTIIRTGQGSSEDPTIVIFDEEVIVVPHQSDKNQKPKNDDGISQVKKNSISQNSKNEDSGGKKPSVIGESLDATTKNNGTHTPSNKTEIVDDTTPRNSGNYMTGSDEDSKDHKSSSKIHHTPNDEDHPYVYGKNETLNSEPGGNSTQNGGNSSHPITTSKSSQNASLSDGKPSVIGQSLNATTKNNETNVPSNKTEIVDDTTSKNPGNHSKESNEDSKDHKSSPGNDKSSSIDKANNTHTNQKNEQWETKPRRNSTRNGGNSSHPVSISKPSQNATSSDAQPRVISKSLNATTKNNETHVPSNKTEVVDDNTPKNPGNHSKVSNEDSKDLQSSPGNDQSSSIDKVNNTHINQTNEQWETKPRRNSTQNGGNSSHLVDTSKPVQNANSSGAQPSVIGQSLNATTKNNETNVPSNKTEVVDDTTSKNVGNYSKGSNEDSKDHKSSPIDKVNNRHTNQKNEQWETKPLRNSTQNGGNISHPITTSKASQNESLSDGKPSVIGQSLNATTKNNETNVPSNKTEIVDDTTSKNPGNHSKESNEDSKDHKSSPGNDKSSSIDKTNNTHTNQTNGLWETKPYLNSTQNEGNSSHPISTSTSSQNASLNGEKPSVIGESVNATIKNKRSYVPSNETEIVDDKTPKNLGNYSKGSNEDSKDHKSSPIDKTHKANNIHTNQTNEQSNSEPARNSTQKITAVTLNNSSSDLQEIKGSDNDTILPETNESFEGGTTNQTAPFEFID